MSKKAPLFVGFGLALAGGAAIAAYLATNKPQAEKLATKLQEFTDQVVDTVNDYSGRVADGVLDGIEAANEWVADTLTPVVAGIFSPEAPSGYHSDSANHFYSGGYAHTD
ncbi:MAG: hypothetical protein WAQ27_05905 [Candidatus Microsaccharimonas sp.]